MNRNLFSLGVIDSILRSAFLAIEYGNNMCRVIDHPLISNLEADLATVLADIDQQPLVLETWDEELWLSLLDTATIHKDNRITFRFKNGTEIEVGVK